MAGMGAAPKVDDERRRRNQPTFSWTDLPAEGRKGKPPALPKWRSWRPATKAWWADLWATPQATAWDQSGRTLWRLAELRDDGFGEGGMTAVRSAEMRQIEDRHGLSPKAMLGLRWRIVAKDEPASMQPTARGRRQQSRRAGALKVITGDGGS